MIPNALYKNNHDASEKSDIEADKKIKPQITKL